MQPNSITLAPESSDPPTDPVARAFWRWQIAGWLIYGVAMYFAAAQQLPPVDAFVNKSVNTAIGFAFSLGLRSAWLGLRARALPPARLLPILAAGCVAAGAAWSVLANSAYWWYRGLDFTTVAAATFFDWTLMHAVALIAWCAIYVGFQLHDELQKMRALEWARAAQRTLDVRVAAPGELVRKHAESCEPAPLVVRTDGGIVRIAQSEIVCIESARNYSCIVGDSRVHVVRSTLGALASRLDAGRFLRVHRSTIVAVGKLVGLRSLPGNDAVATLAGGREVRVSRRFRAAVEDALRRH